MQACGDNSIAEAACVQLGLYIKFQGHAQHIKSMLASVRAIYHVAGILHNTANIARGMQTCIKRWRRMTDMFRDYRNVLRPRADLPECKPLRFKQSKPDLESMFRPTYLSPQHSITASAGPFVYINVQFWERVPDFFTIKPILFMYIF